MASHLASIERSNRKDLHQIEVQLTVREASAGQPSWSGEFMCRSADGIVPNERLAFTLDTGQRGTARVCETYFDSRTPATTRIRFDGMGPLI